MDDGGGSRAGKNIGHTPNTFFNILVALLRQSLVDLKWHVGCVWDSLCDNLLNSMWDSMWDSMCDNLLNSMWDSVWDSLWDNLSNSMWDSMWDGVR